MTMKTRLLQLEQRLQAMREPTVGAVDPSTLTDEALQVALAEARVETEREAGRSLTEREFVEHLIQGARDEGATAAELREWEGLLACVH